MFKYKNRNKVENFLHQNVAFMTNYEPINLTQKPRLMTFYQCMSDNDKWQLYMTMWLWLVNECVILDSRN